MSKKKILALVLMAVMILQVIGCSVQNPNAPAAPAPAPAPNEGQPAAETPSNEPAAAEVESGVGYTYDDSTWGVGNPTIPNPTPTAVQIGPESGAPCSLIFTDILPVEDGPIGDPNRTYRIGLSLPKTNNPWFVGITDSMMLQAQKHPNVELVILNANGDAAQQANDIEALRVQQVDAIVVDPIQEEALVPAMKSAKAAGSLVFGVDRNFADDTAYVSQVTGDPYQAPKDLANWSINFLTEKYGEPRGKIAMIQVDMGSTPQIVRHDAFMEVISQYPDIEVVGMQSADGDEQKAYTIMTDIASAHPDVDIVYGHADNMTMGAYKALDAMGRTEGVAFIGVDVSKEGASWLRDGKLSALAPWTPYMGDIVLRLAIYALEGKPIPRQVWLPDQPLVTTENVAVECGSAFGPVPAGYEDMWVEGKVPGDMS